MGIQRATAGDGLLRQPGAHAGLTLRESRAGGAIRIPGRGRQLACPVAIAMAGDQRPREREPALREVGRLAVLLAHRDRALEQRQRGLGVTARELELTGAVPDVREDRMVLAELAREEVAAHLVRRAHNNE